MAGNPDNDSPQVPLPLTARGHARTTDVTGARDDLVQHVRRSPHQQANILQLAPHTYAATGAIQESKSDRGTRPSSKRVNRMECQELGGIQVLQSRSKGSSSDKDKFFYPFHLFHQFISYKLNRENLDSVKSAHRAQTCLSPPKG